MNTFCMKADKIKTYSLLLNIVCLLIIGILFLNAENGLIKQKNVINNELDEWHYEDNPFFVNYTTNHLMYKKRKNIVMLGTSLTAFSSWCELLDREDIASRGINGDITAGMLARIEEVINNIQPKICFIEAGINDLQRGISKETIIANLDQMINELLANDIVPVLNTVNYLNEQYDLRDVNEFNNRIYQLNQTIKNLATLKNIRVLDLNQHLSEQKFMSYEFSMPDGIHLNAKAYVLWKLEIEKILDELNI